MHIGQSRLGIETNESFFSIGWQSVEIGDGLLIGSAEGGFSGLEEFTPPQGIMIQGGAGVENLYEVLDTKTPQGTGKSSGTKTPPMTQHCYVSVLRIGCALPILPQEILYMKLRDCDMHNLELLVVSQQIP